MDKLGIFHANQTTIGCPKRYETFLNLNKSPTLSLAYLNVLKYKKDMKNLFHRIARIILCKHYASCNIKDGVTK